MPLSVGLLPLIGILFYLLASKRDDRELRSIGNVSLGLGLAALLISSTIFPWTYVAKIPVLGELLYAAQFPWRYLGIAGFFLAVVFGIGAYGLFQNRGKVLVAACLLLAVFNIAPFLDQYVQADNQTYVMQSKYDTSSMKSYATWDYGYDDTDFEALESLPIAIDAPGGAQISEFLKSGTHVSFAYTAETEQTVVLPLYFYPGYTAVLNGTQALSPLDGENHLLTLSLPAGEGAVSVRYEGFWYFNVANFISLLTLFTLLGVYTVIKLRNVKPRSALPR
jgi:hypothetical protein